jgi:3-mercaptopyruvate sulfurtransferase SseA
VREPDEVMQGNIPSSVNLPMSQLEGAIASDEGDFTRINGFKKPTKDQQIMWVAPVAAPWSDCWRTVYIADLASAAKAPWITSSPRVTRSACGPSLGHAPHLWHSVRNYRGSWTDWSSQQKKSGSH